MAASQLNNAEVLRITNQLASMRERLDGVESLVRRGRIRRSSLSYSSSSSSSGRVRESPMALAAESSVLSTVNEDRGASVVPAVAADGTSSPVPQEDASRDGITRPTTAAPSPLPTVHTTNNEDSIQPTCTTGRIDAIDEVVIVDDTLKDADYDDNSTKEEEREDRTK